MTPPALAPEPAARLEIDGVAAVGYMAELPARAPERTSTALGLRATMRASEEAV